MTRDEDALWQEIVDNYGETASVDEVDGDDEGDENSTDGEAAATDEPAPDPHPELYVIPEPEPATPPELTSTWEDEGRFVPPDPEPIPLAEPPRMLGWLGVFGAPIIALVTLVLGHPFRGILAVLLVAWFTGGFIYLIRTMNAEPREPWDDGSRI